MENICCPLCKSVKTNLLFRRKDLTHHISDIEFSVVRCKRCGLAYVNPRPTKEEIHSYYPEEFYEIADKEEVLKQKEKRLLAKYDLVKHIEKGKLLDIGCNKGEFLYFMQKKGWIVKGVEFSAKPPNLFNQDIFYGELKDAYFPEKAFDLVTLWAVLEHVYDPMDLLHEINRVLVPQGRIVLLVTNINSIPARFMRHDDIPRHTTLFSKRTIAKMLKLSGFKVQKYYFSQDIFSGSVRGILNYLIKLLYGEKMDDIVAQNRSKDRWFEFARKIKGSDFQLMEKIDNFDIKITPYLDKILDFLQLGFIMIVQAQKINK